MALVAITNVTVLDTPTMFSNPFQFEVTFECLGELKEDLEWKILYVGSAESEEHDQVLDSILVGPVPLGVSKFVFQSNPPDASLVPAKDLLGVTVILLTCSYRGQEFVRVGYYVNNEYVDEELIENPPSVPDITKIRRDIYTDAPRVTRRQINWSDDPTPAAAAVAPGVGIDDKASALAHEQQQV